MKILLGDPASTPDRSGRERKVKMGRDRKKETREETNDLEISQNPFGGDEGDSN